MPGSWSANAAAHRCCCSTRSPPISTRDRRHALFEIILDVGAQAWLTGTDAGVFRPLGGHAQFFAVRPGTVEGA